MVLDILYFHLNSKVVLVVDYTTHRNIASRKNSDKRTISVLLKRQAVIPDEEHCNGSKTWIYIVKAFKHPKSCDKSPFFVL